MTDVGVLADYVAARFAFRLAPRVTACARPGIRVLESSTAMGAALTTEVRRE